jgi:ABC-type transporter Mla subunit MlaD
VDQIKTLAAQILNEFSSLPLLTQWSVAILISVGFVVHVFVYNERTAHDGPSIFTTAGIFFTFVGIAEGLFGFDSLDIERSVPTLLGGLKTAFIASVFGVGIALTLKLRVILFGLPQSGGSDSVHGATIDDLANQLIAVRSALTGQDDSTLVSQLKLTRQDTNDRLDSLKKSQSDFMEKMAENNSKALIQALQEVIRDFNAKINEQFGENFKQLNSAVGQLLQWQDNYRIQLSELIEREKISATAMQLSAERFAEVVTKSDVFAATSEKLVTILEGLETQLENLDTQRTNLAGNLESLGSLLLAASSSLPQVEDKIVDLTEQLNEGVRRNIDEMREGIEKTSATVHDTVVDAKRLLTDVISSANNDLNAHVKQLSEKATEQIAKLDLALERELTKSITTLASQLTALSKQFVDDYGPLTSNLRDIVRSAGSRS